LRSIQLWTTIVVLVLAPLFFGSVDLFWIAVWTILLSLSALCGGATQMDPGQGRLLLCFFGVCGVYALVAIIQIVPDAFGSLNDPVWRRATEILGLQSSPRISSRAEIPPIAIGHFLLFVTAFFNGFCVGTSRHSSDILMRSAQYSILCYAIYGLVALVLTPNMVLWAPKLAYLGDLTATFINHNTAATFIGAGAILWLCFACSSLQAAFRFSSIRLLLMSRSNERLAFKIILRSGGALVCFFALLLTSSRGGLIGSCVGLLAAIMLMTTDWQRPRFWRVAISSAVALAVIVILLSETGRIGSEGLFDDGRWSAYQLCLQAIRQRPVLGAGLGTFADLFPSLLVDESHDWGVWDFAHSTILEIGVEMGVPVAAMVAIAALVSVFILVRAAIRSDGRGRRTLAAITGITTLSYLHSLIDFSLQIPGYLAVFGILLGCGLARASAAETKRSAERPLRQPEVETRTGHRTETVSPEMALRVSGGSRLPRLSELPGRIEPVSGWPNGVFDQPAPDRTPEL
jgi:O-antigen ligase